MSQLLAELENVTWDVILISESRTPSGTYYLDGGHILYTVLLDDDFLGTGILLHAKHVKGSNVIHRVCSRVLGLDLRVNGIKIRAVAVYVPHCGYDIEHFNETFDQLRYFASVGRKKGRRLVIGGDFNTQIGIGSRGECLDEFVRTFCLTIANKNNAPWDDQWTFSSSLGDKRKIDFIIVSSAFQSIEGKAVNDINLGSDHRVVRGYLQVRAFHPYIKAKRKKIRKWRPALENSVASNYLSPLEQIG